MAISGGAFPILPGKTEAWKQFNQAIIDRRTEWEESRKRLGVLRESSIFQSTPMGDLAVVFVETVSGDMLTLMQVMGKSDLPFDKWFLQKVKELHGIDFSEPLPGPAPQLMLDIKRS